MYFDRKMPKVRQTPRCPPKLEAFKRIDPNFDENYLSYNFSINRTLYCLKCKSDIICQKLNHLLQHINGAKHKQIIKESLETTEPNVSQKQFYLDLCLFLVSLNIAFNKVNDKRFKDFIEKYTGFMVPHGLVLSRYYLPKIDEKTIDYIRENVTEYGCLWTRKQMVNKDMYQM